MPKQKSTKQLLKELREYNEKWNKPSRKSSQTGSVMFIPKRKK